MSDMDYQEFLSSKQHKFIDAGFEAGKLNPNLFDWQESVVRWALRKGRACLFEDCGLGKTLQQLAWADAVPGKVLVLAPLSVAGQTKAEADKFGIDAAVSMDGTVHPNITITNYEKIHLFMDSDGMLSQFDGVVLDESSILKAHNGKTRNAIIEGVQCVPYRLACTATPAPNDHMELGNHAEFVGAMTRWEMLSMFFINDGSDTKTYRLKGHAKEEFWSWVATWAFMVRTPEDIGFQCEGYDLPPLTTTEHIVNVNIVNEGELFAAPALTLNDQRRARRETLERRVQMLAGIVNASDDQWVVWCELNDEGNALAKAINGAVQVSGKDSDEDKIRKFEAFQNGDARVMVTKPKIAGFGLNWQHCHKMGFVGLSHSWEQYYQAVRREWRFGQTSPVDVHIVTTDAEIAVLENIKRKQSDADEMAAQMVQMMKGEMMSQLEGWEKKTNSIDTGAIATGEGWILHHNDCVEALGSVESDSVGYTIFSPPFASLYMFSDDPRDMSNCDNHAQFYEHFRHLVPELLRVTMPGRLCSFHCINMPTSKARDGVIGLSDFRGDLIRLFTAAGWIYHAEAVIWKDPVVAMQRTKSIGLLHKQLKKDSTMSRMGIPDYVITMRKPGENPVPVSHTDEEFPVHQWQKYASPIWYESDMRHEAWNDINQSDTLQFRSAREHEDEKHICPLQLSVIRRCLELWSTEGDLVCSPFTGIGSEAVCSLELGRQFVGAELKKSYFDMAVKNIKAATAQGRLL